MVVEYLAAAKTAYEIAKGVKTSIDALDDANMKLQMADIMMALAEVKVQAAESVDKIAELERQLATRHAMEFNGYVYWRTLGKNEDGEDVLCGPYCPTCYDANNKEIRLQTYTHSYKDGRGAITKVTNNWLCRVCKNQYNK